MIWASFPDPHPEYFVPEPYASMYDPEKLTLDFLVDGEHDKSNPLIKKTQELKPDYSEFDESGHYLHGCHNHSQTVEDIKKDAALYYGMVTFMDEHIGLILDKLEALNLLSETLVIFTTDHGHFYGQHGLIRKGPFHYEDAIKIPFLAALERTIPKASRSDALNTLVDLTPTMLDFLDIDIPLLMTGISQKDVLTNKTNQVRDHIICGNKAEQNKLNMRTYVDQRYKLTIYQDHDFGELFDLLKDPKELNNLWDDQAHTELKLQLFQKYANAELKKEQIKMPKITGA